MRGGMERGSLLEVELVHSVGSYFKLELVQGTFIRFGGNCNNLRKNCRVANASFKGR